MNEISEGGKLSQFSPSLIIPHSMIMGTSVFFLGSQFCDVVTKMTIKSLGRFGQNMKVKKV
jgi:hypothetical protein